MPFPVNYASPEHDKEKRKVKFLEAHAKLAWSKIRKTSASYSVSVSWVIGWRLNSFLVQT